MLLLALADHMCGDGYVIVPRRTLALQVDKSERTVSERLQQGVEARLLDGMQRGQKGRTTTYPALLPGGVRVPNHSTPGRSG